ncbi:M56 family metallopeptidase [Streptomyces sp. OF3]|uniref:M56 family metallopeptidase n=1 Tax=Streptomyces alkaliterrae TaxID=2213162 RepID=A0A7W3ZLN8_9ACTN|nr:M48 family metalloprotease [Streptomyces alkaliterrae]MBB1252611.1 M56 family metallopeptidase [Streptomyces alkaliterrae]
MGVFVFLPLVLPLSAWPIARLAERHLHPRAATWLLTVVAAVLAVCSTLCLALVMVVGTAQLPGNPLPDSWSSPRVQDAVPYDEVAGKASIPALGAVLAACARTAWRHHRLRSRAARALLGLPAGPVAVLPDELPYAYALPGKPGRVVATTGMLRTLTSPERRVLFAHERAHLTHRHHRFLLTVQIAARANPFLRPLRTAVGYTTERWADEEAAARVGDRRLVARAVGRAALISRGYMPAVGIPDFASPGPVPRRVAALLEPTPAPRNWPPVFTAVGLAAWAAAAGATASALSSANAAVSLFLILKAATPL